MSSSRGQFQLNFVEHIKLSGFIITYLLCDPIIEVIQSKIAKLCTHLIFQIIQYIFEYKIRKVRQKLWNRCIFTFLVKPEQKCFHMFFLPCASHPMLVIGCSMLYQRGKSVCFFAPNIQRTRLQILHSILLSIREFIIRCHNAL